MWRVMIGSRGTPLVLCFFNGKLTKGLKSKVLQSARTNVKQKKCRDQCQNWTKVQGLNTHLTQNNLAKALTRRI